ncbi:acyl-coenzyme A oxidase [Stylosanthes scabra]|uniref:Acyl-coenzyme A oxidase n=1 Tax=Stylosanthes scabra TaxID=79078 RepID=A0ABU6YFM2_9FABA|nr:acyl-coenzyme A oxidase [Stylosanthes scabra]
MLFLIPCRYTVNLIVFFVEKKFPEEEDYKLRFFVDQPAFTDLHWGMFMPAIEGLGTDEQQQKWLPLAYKMQIIGCYAQTQLGHGSHVQWLETTATFDPATNEFVLHSPTLTSNKVSYMNNFL